MLDSFKNRAPLSKKHRKLGVIFVTLALITTGSLWATFTDSVSTQTQNLTTGSGSLIFTSGSLVNSVDSSVSDLVPGDSVTRDLTLLDGASYDLSKIQLDVTDSNVPLDLTTSPEGLKLTIQREISPNNWFTIYGPAAPTGLSLMSDVGGNAKFHGGSDHLRFTQKFVGPDNSQALTAKSAKIIYTFIGTQRDPLLPPPPYQSAITSDSPSFIFPLTDATGSTQSTSADNTRTYSCNNLDPCITSASGLVSGSTKADTLSENFDINAAPNTNLANGTGSYTDDFWFSYSGANNGQLAAFQANTGYGYTATIFSNASISLRNNSGTSANTGANSFSLNTPTHFALLVNGSSATIYLNGISTISIPVIGPIAVQEQFIVGSPSASHNSITFAYLASYPNALSSTRIAAHYAAGH